MKRKLSQKETNFLKELEELLSRNEASVAVLNDRVSFFIDNKEEGDCVPTESYTDAASLSRLIKKGRVRLDWRQPEQYSAKAKALEALSREGRYELIDSRSSRTTGSIISVDDRARANQSYRDIIIPSGNTQQRQYPRASYDPTTRKGFEKRLCSMQRQLTSVVSALNEVIEQVGDGTLFRDTYPQNKIKRV